MTMPSLLVFPVRTDSKAPAIKDWHDKARHLDQWMEEDGLQPSQWLGHQRWGAPCGVNNGFWVLDIDPRHGGLDTLRQLTDLYGALPLTRIVKTPSGGYHYYFRWEPWCEGIRNTAGVLGAGLDIRTQGGMVLVPPTPGYTAECDSPIASAPAWLAALLLPKLSGSDNRKRDNSDGEAPLRRPREHFARALQAAIEEIQEAAPGSRDATMNRNAYGLGRAVEAAGQDPDKVIDVLVSACIDAGYAPSKVTDCVPRALRAGMEHPRVAEASPAPAVATSNGPGSREGETSEAVALRPCPPKPGPQPADLTSEAGRRWTEKNNEYQSWQRDVRAVLDARLVVILYDQTRVLYRRHGLRRVELLGTADHQAGSIIHIGEEHGFLISAGQASSLAEEYLRLSTARVITEHPTMWDAGEGLYRWESPSADAGAGMPCPTWETVLDRLSDPEAFLAHVWSIFEPRYKGRQVLWLQGAGNDGKSLAITSLIRGAKLPIASLSDGDLVAGNQFLFSSVWDKPLVLVQESKNVNVLMTGTVHKLTGRDMVSVEYKHGQRFTAQFQGVVFVTSNGLPQIENTASNKTRLTIVTIAPPKRFIPHMEEMLKAEVPALLFRARNAYALRCKDHYRIDLNEEAQAAVNAATGYEDETHATMLFASGIRIEGDGFLSRKEIMKQMVGTGAKLDANRTTSFYRWLAEQPGVSPAMREGARGFKGLKL